MYKGVYSLYKGVYYVQAFVAKWGSRVQRLPPAGRGGVRIGVFLANPAVSDKDASVNERV